MKVLKFGGTSVANAENIQLVKNIVQKESSSNYLCVVVSALGGVTDLLLDSVFLASQQKEAYQETFQLIEKKHLEVVKKLIPVQQQSSVMSFLKRELNILETLLEGAFLIGETTPKLLDKILGYGEILSSKIIHSYFTAEGISCAYKDSRELIKTNTQFGRALVNFEITEKNLTENITETETQVYLMPGFVASSLAGDSTTLGRGGSDYTAAIVAAALDAEVLEIWTDVSGMFTANPRLVKQAVAIEEISYQEAMELSHFGAKVLYPPTIQPVLAKEIPIHIKNTFLPAEKGTLITKNTNGKNRPVRGISHIENISLLSLEGPC